MKESSPYPGLRVIVKLGGRAAHGVITRKSKPGEGNWPKPKYNVLYDYLPGNPNYDGWHDPIEMQKETFAQYCTLPTGFGRTSWWSFGLIQMMCIGLVSFAAADEGGAAIAIVSAFVIECVLVLGTWMNFKGRWK